MNVRPMNTIVMKTQTAWITVVHTSVYAEQATLAMDWHVKVKYKLWSGLGFNFSGVH